MKEKKKTVMNREWEKQLGGKQGPSKKLYELKQKNILQKTVREANRPSEGNLKVSMTAEI